MYKLAVFDIDGTLVDSEQTGVESLRVTLRELMGKEISYEESYATFGIPSAKVSHIYNYPDHEHFARTWENNYIALSHLIEFFPGMQELMREVKAAGIATGIVTARNRYEFGKDERIRTITGYVDAVVCAEDTQHHKPHPEPLLRCIELAAQKHPALSITPENTIYFGDTAYDCECAKGAGCDFALADWKGRGWQDIPADFKFDRAAFVMDILLRGGVSEEE